MCLAKNSKYSLVHILVMVCYDSFENSELEGGVVMGRSIAVVSGKGGVGKTTVSVGLALALAKLGKSVCLIDADMGLSNVDTLLSLDSKVVFTLSDVLSRKCRIKQALIEVESARNLYVLLSGRVDARTEIDDPVRFSEIVSRLTEVFDFCLIDAPAGASVGFRSCIAAANEVLVVVTPHIVSVRDADKVLSVISASGTQNVMCVVNRIRADLVVAGKMISEREISAVLNARLVGVVPESKDILVLSSIDFVKATRGDVEESFLMLAKSIQGSVRLFDYKKKYKGILGFVRRKMIKMGGM